MARYRGVYLAFKQPHTAFPARAVAGAGRVYGDIRLSRKAEQVFAVGGEYNNVLAALLTKGDFITGHLLVSLLSMNIRALPFLYFNIEKIKANKYQHPYNKYENFQFHFTYTSFPSGDDRATRMNYIISGSASAGCPTDSR
jgi:hypothetical protein